MTKKTAIKILTDFLEAKKRIEPGNGTYLYLDRVKEHKFCWEIPHTSEEYHKSKNPLLMPVGAGAYLVDKKNGKIYLTGSAPIDWIKDFELMKAGQKPEWNWKELRNYFLDVQFEILPQRILFTKLETVKQEQIDSFLEVVFRDFKANNKNGLSPKIKRLEYDEFRSTFLIGYPKGGTTKVGTSLEIIKLNEMYTISLNYCREGYYSFVGPLNEIRNWLKLNPQYKTTNNYWIEEIETDTSKPFNKWNLKMSLEIRNTN